MLTLSMKEVYFLKFFDQTILAFSIDCAGPPYYITKYPAILEDSPPPSDVLDLPYLH